MQTMIKMLSLIQDNFMHISVWMFPVMFFLIALFYLLLREGKINRNYLYLGLGTVLLWLSPFAANNITTFFTGDRFMYGKVLFVIPIVAFISYAVVQLYFHEMKRKKVLLLCFAFLLLQVGFRFDYDLSTIQTQISLQKIPDEVEEIAEMLAPFPSKCVAPEEVASTIKEAGMSTDVLYGNYAYDSTDVKEMVETADTYDCNVIILKTKDDDEAYLKKKGFERLLETEHYRVYVYLK